MRTHQRRMPEDLGDQTQTDGEVQRDLSRKFEAIKSGAITFRTMTLNSMADTEFLGLKEYYRREDIGNIFPLPSRPKKKLNVLLKLMEITHRR